MITIRIEIESDASGGLLPHKVMTEAELLMKDDLFHVLEKLSWSTGVVFTGRTSD
jgi:hypothetical protein